VISTLPTVVMGASQAHGLPVRRPFTRAG